MQTTADFFTDAPLPHYMDGWRAEWQARIERLARWAGHVVVEVNGHVVWKRSEDIEPEDMRVFYDGDYSNVLAPDDPRILVPREQHHDLPPWPGHLEWDE